MDRAKWKHEQLQKAIRFEKNAATQLDLSKVFLFPNVSNFRNMDICNSHLKSWQAQFVNTTEKTALQLLQEALEFQDWLKTSDLGSDTGNEASGSKERPPG